MFGPLRLAKGQACLGVLSHLLYLLHLRGPVDLLQGLARVHQAQVLPRRLFLQQLPGLPDLIPAISHLLVEMEWLPRLNSSLGEKKRSIPQGYRWTFPDL
jgi:hypothetical protein